MSSFIGCKISLISKAGIRYEGILYTIDPKESTVALSKVKSFGTEDRKVERIIPARDEIYEYIIFRGSDIQDLNVCERSKESTLLLEDSAIVRAETSISGNLPPGVLHADIHQNDSSSSTWKVGNHRSSTKDKPGNSAAKIPPPKEDTVTKMTSNVQPIGSHRQSTHNNEIKKPPIKKNETYNNGDVQYERVKQKPEKGQKSSEKYGPDYGYGEYGYNYNQGYKHRGNTYHNTSMNYSSNRDYNNYDKSSSRYRRTEYSQDQYYATDNYKLRGFESSEHNRDYVFPQQFYGYKPAKERQERYMMYDNMTATSTGANNRQQRPRRTNNNHIPSENNNKQKDAQFKEDYDFETANAIIAQELANMNKSQDRKDITNEEEIVKEDGEVYEEIDAACYDKTKSFFDKISSEMIDRANGKIVRPMNRKEERKMNVETFGMSDTNRSSGRSTNKWSRGSRSGSHCKLGGRAGSNNYVDAVYNGGSRGLGADLAKEAAHSNNGVKKYGRAGGYCGGGSTVRRGMVTTMVGGPCGRGELY